LVTAPFFYKLRLLERAFFAATDLCNNHITCSLMSKALRTGKNSRRALNASISRLQTLRFLRFLLGYLWRLFGRHVRRLQGRGQPRSRPYESGSCCARLQ